MSENKKISKLWLILVVAVFIISVSCVCSTENLPIPDLFGDKGDEDTGEEGPTQVDNALLKDDFSNSNSGWEAGVFEAGEVGYKDGAYFVTSTEKDAMMWGAAGRSFSNVIIDVDAVQVSAPSNNNNDYGIMCRVQFNGDGYSFNISGDGFFSIQKASNDSFIDLIEWQESEAIRQGNNVTNHIRAVCDGEKLVLFANGQLLAETTDSSFTEGDIALTATTYESTMTEIHFDDLVVRNSQ